MTKVDDYTLVCIEQAEMITKEQNLEFFKLIKSKKDEF